MITDLSARLLSRPVLLVAAALGVVSVLIGLLALELHRSYLREIEYATAVTQSIARILEQQLLASMDRIDLIVQEAAVQYAAHRAGTGLAATDMNPMLARHLARVPGVLSLRLINQDGNYVFDASGGVSPANISDRRYFKVQKDGPGVGLFPEGPLFSRVIGKWTLTFSRRVEDRNKTFLGIVQSSIATEALASAFGTVTLGTSDTITLLDGDGVLVARLPDAPDQIGKPAVSETLGRLIRARVPEQVYSGPSGLDGQERLYTLRRIGTHPFFVLVGIAYDRILGEWYRTASIYGAISLLFLAGSMLLAARISQRFSATVRQAEEQRRLTSEVFANALEGIIVTDQDSRILSANRAMCDITGYRLEDLIGKTPRVFGSRVHAPGFFETFWSTLQSQGHWQGEIWNRRKSGTVFPEWLSVSVIGDRHGQALRYIGIYTDISEQKAVQKRLEFTNAELVRLTEVMAHHLQEPARRLVTYAQRLRTALGERTLTEDAGHSLTFIEQQAGRLRALIRDIQLYLAADHPMGNARPQTPAAVLHAVLARRAADLTAAEVTVAPAIPALQLDPGRFATIMQALLDNALRYRRPDGPLRLQISCEVDGRMVRLRFADNGPGIAPEYRDLVFQVFERLEITADDRTGIGLSVVRRIVEHGNGKVWIEETPGGGTTIVLDLPTGVDP